MCFYKVFNEQPRIASRNIYVQKLLLVRADRIITPFLKFEIKELTMTSPLGSGETDEVHEGIHSFCNKTVPEDYLTFPGSRCYSATIPKGTPYYRGKQPDGLVHYVSERLVLNKQVLIDIKQLQDSNENQLSKKV